MSQCPELIAQFQKIKDWQTKLNQEIEDYSDKKNVGLNFGQKIEVFINIYRTKKQLLVMIKELVDNSWEKKIEAMSYVRTGDGKQCVSETTVLDFEKTVNNFKIFYNEHGIELPENFEKKARVIWEQNYKEIKKEIAIYGYNHILIIPDNLPPMDELFNKMSEGYLGLHPSTGKELLFVKNSSKKSNTFRLVLVHEAQKIDQNFYLKLTAGFPSNSPCELLNKNFKVVKEIIAKGGDPLINFDIRKNRHHATADGKHLLESIYDNYFGDSKDTRNSRIKAEGMSLDEYLIFQRQYFESTGKHLDVAGNSWLISSYFGSKMLRISWSAASDCLAIGVGEPDEDASRTGCRFTRTFTLKEEKPKNKWDPKWNTIPWRPA